MVRRGRRFSVRKSTHGLLFVASGSPRSARLWARRSCSVLRPPFWVSRRKDRHTGVPSFAGIDYASGHATDGPQVTDTVPPRTRRWRIIVYGRQVILASLWLHEYRYPNGDAKIVAKCSSSNVLRQMQRSLGNTDVSVAPCSIVRFDNGKLLVGKYGLGAVS